MAKRYFWLKLHDDFFDSKRIKKLRRMAGGDTYTIIYLKMQLLAIKSEGVLKWTGLEQSMADEIALDIDESPDDVRVTISYLISCGLAECEDEVNLFLPYAISNTGSENASAQRVRDYRERQKALHCNNDETDVKRIGNAEIEIEKEKEIEIESEIEIEIDKRRFTPPTAEEVIEYAVSKGKEFDARDAEMFIGYYASKNWMVGKTKMTSWHGALSGWIARDEKRRKPF